MITLITALYPEAKPFITALHLKQQPEETHYQLFEGEGIRLLVTGTGMISAATAAARHFALYPPETEQDLILNIGVAGYVPGTALSFEATALPQGKEFSSATPHTGDLFLASRLTEQATGRTFYPDFLYKHAFHLLPLATTPVVCTDASEFPEETLVDMEATALYQALLPHIFPDRMLYFKIISDVIGEETATQVRPEELLSPHAEAILSYAMRLHEFLKATAHPGITYTEEEAAFISQIRALLPMTETMSREFERLLAYAKLSGNTLNNVLKDFVSTLSETTIRGKKQAMPYLEMLREMILNATGEPETPLECSPATSLYQPFFATVYAEKEAWSVEWQQKLSATPIFINHYKDIFNRSHQDFAAQKKAPSLILAKKTGTLIYKGAPVCQSFGNEHFYYTSCMMNCIYHCDYCYLQGMYPSGHVVVFVNLEDYFAELETLLKEHPVYLCVSYDTDLLALEQTFSFVSRWLAFAAEHPALTLEIRTKSGNPAVFSQLAALYQGKENLQRQIIFAWTVSPEQVSQSTEHGAASLHLRLNALQAAKEAGFSVRLCFDPMIFHAGWKKSYSTLVDTIFRRISADILYDVSIGVFRISTDYLKNMRKKRPDSAIVQYPYLTERGVSHYGGLSDEMIQYLRELLLPYLPAEKLFVWEG